MINTTNFRQTSEPNIFHAISRGGMPQHGSVPASPARSSMYHIPNQGMQDFQASHAPIEQFYGGQFSEMPQPSNY